MNRQRVLERVGWQFWRCFASSFYRDTEGVVKDLLEALSRMGIEPAAGDDGARATRYTEHRVILPEPPSAAPDVEGIEEFDVRAEPASPSIAEPDCGIAIGDRVVLLFSDEMRRRSVTIVDGSNDLDNGHLSVSTPLGRAVLGAEEGDEIVFRLDDGRERKALIESVEKGSRAPRDDNNWERGRESAPRCKLISEDLKDQLCESRQVRLGHKRTYAVQKGMSALPPKADMCSATRDARFVPIADIAGAVEMSDRPAILV